MKYSIVFALFCCFMFQIVLSQKNQRQCVGEHERWGCQSPTVECQRSCANRKVHLERFIKCETACELACVCDPGYYRHNNHCVGRAECPGATPEDPQVPPRRAVSGNVKSAGQKRPSRRSERRRNFNNDQE